MAERMRITIADALRRLADRLDPDTAQRRRAVEWAIRDLGEWAYGGAPWTSVRTMMRTALERARADRSWWDRLG